MIQVISEGMTLDKFLDWYPDGYGRYELRNRAVIKMQPTGTHEQVKKQVILEGSNEQHR